MNDIIEPTMEEIWESLQFQGKSFLSGSSGTGKSTLCRGLMEKAEEAGWLVYPTATTGIAARNLSKTGTTIHSTVKMGISQSIEEYSHTRNSKFRHIGIPDRQGIKALLIIDEISMFSASQLELVLHILNMKLKKTQVSILLVGDFLQLPTVSNGSAINYCFLSSAFREFKPFLLSINKRNTEKYWNIFLNRVRVGYYDRNDENFLASLPNVHVINDAEDIPQGKEPIVLMATNKNVYQYNLERLLKLPTENQEVFYELETTVDFKNNTKRAELDQWYENNEAKFIKEFGDMSFFFKIGARVMITSNNAKLGIVNGDVGTIVRYDEDLETIFVELDDGMIVGIVKKEHEIFKPGIVDKDKVLVPLVKISHYPLKIGYAISIHKSQGSSFDNMFFDPKGVFAPSQTFVAISRLRTNGILYLTTTDLARYVFVDKQALAYQQSIQN